MRCTLLLSACAALCGLAAAALAAGAQPVEGKAASGFGYATPMPEGVAIPDRIESRIGTLGFFGGAPDQATASLLHDNLDFQRAVQAYLLALPVVSQAAHRAAMLSIGPANTTVPIWQRPVDARTVALAANDNAPFAWFWLDLGEGPLVLETPPRLVGFADDIWHAWVGDFGIAGLDKGKGGKYLLLPPGWRASVPGGYIVLRPGSNSVRVFWRDFLLYGDPETAAGLVRAHTRIYPLGGEANPPALDFVEMSGEPFNTVAPADYAFWELLNEVVQTEPTRAVDATTLGFWASLGIEKGRPFAPDARMRAILTEAAAVGDATARTLLHDWSNPDGSWYPDRNWRRGFVGGHTFSSGGGRDLDASARYFLHATGVTPAMDERIVGEGSQTLEAFVDSEGAILDGGRSYRLHLPREIPVRSVWSVIVYDNQTRSMIQTDQQVPSVSNATRALRLNGDGSIDVWFGPTAPEGWEANWVQTVPGRSWNTLLRLFGPLEAFYDRSWRPGDIELVR